MIRSLTLALVVATLVPSSVAEIANAPKNPGTTGVCAKVDVPMLHATGLIPQMSFMQKYCYDTYHGWESGFNFPAPTMNERNRIVQSRGQGCVHATSDEPRLRCDTRSMSFDLGRIARYHYDWRL